MRMGQIARQIGVSREAPLLRFVTLCRPNPSHIARVDPDDLAAWCETRDGSLVFRVDRMSALASLVEGFLDGPGRTAEDFLKQDIPRLSARRINRLEANGGVRPTSVMAQSSHIRSPIGPHRY